ncbi:MAG: GNAT family N-acetyltransferase [Caulobacterales bacterium]|nr:GNAT family N-acetyltransferase [Caulobacterales bacterium]
MRSTLVTDRLTLRAPREEDAARLAKLANDPAIAGMTQMIPHPYPPEAVEGWILIQKVRRLARREFVFAIEADWEGVVGTIGVFKRHARADWELGYWIGRPYWGRGYATEAVEAAVDFAQQDLRADPLIAAYFEGNDASRCVLERNGFRPTGASSRVYALGRAARVDCVNMERHMLQPAHAAEEAGLRAAV